MMVSSVGNTVIANTAAVIRRIFVAKAQTRTHAQ